MSNRWYYQLLMEEFGPVTDEQLQQLIDEGTLAGDDPIRAEHSTQWTTVASLATTAAATAVSAAEPETLADLADLTFEFEESQPTTRSATAKRTVAPPADSPLETDSLLAELPPIISNAEADLLEPISKPSAAKSAGSTDHYFCQSLGQTLGPMPLAELVGMFASGALVSGDLISRNAQAGWQPSPQFPEIVAAVQRALPNGVSSIPTAAVQSSPLSVATQKRLAHPAPEHPHSPPAISAEQTMPQTSENISGQPTNRSSTKPAPAQQPASAQASASAKASTELPGGDQKRSASAREGARSRNKKKPARNEDAVLEEIFDDVFSDDAAKPPSSRPPMYSVPTEVAGGPTGVAGGSNEVAGGPNEVARAGTFSAPAPPSSSSRPAVSPKRKPASSTRTPLAVSGRTMGIVGGSLAVIALVAGVLLGAIPLPGLGGVLRANPVTVLEGVHAKVKDINPDTITQDELTQLQLGFLDDVSYALQDLEHITDPTPRHMAMKAVGRKLLDIGYVRHDAKAILKQFLDEVNQLMVNAPK